MKEHPTLRFHRIDLGFFKEDGTIAFSKEIILEDKEVTEIEADLTGVCAILPNYKDYSFIKIILDDESSDLFKKKFASIEEPLSKGLILRALFDGVKDGNYKATEFINLCCSIIESEPSVQVLDTMYGYVAGALNFIREANKGTFCTKLYKLTRAKLLTFKEPATIRSLLQKLILYCKVADDVDDLYKLLNGTNEELKYDLAIEDKWKIVFKMHGCGKYSAEDLKATYDKLYAEDSSDTKKSYELKIKALTATDDERKALFEEYFGSDSKMSYKDLEASLSGFWSSYIALDRRKAHYDEFFAKIVEATRTKTKEVARTLYYGSLSGNDDHDLKIAKLTEIVKDIKDDEIFQKKIFNQSLEELNTIKRAREFDSSA